MRATRRAARDDPDPQIHAKETILHLLRLLFLNILPTINLLALRFAYHHLAVRCAIASAFPAMWAYSFIPAATSLTNTIDHLLSG